MNVHEGQEKRRQVLVVGAGPVGMVSALSLHNQGIAVTILEADPKERIRPGSRAIYLHQATLKLLEEVSPGLGNTLAKKDVVWPVKHTLFRGKEVYVRHYKTPDPNVLPPFTSLPQVEIEKYLYKACLGAGIVFVWDSPITEVNTNKSRVIIKTESGIIWNVEYMIGADGARSVIRNKTGIKFEGPRIKDLFHLLDHKLKLNGMQNCLIMLE